MRLDRVDLWRNLVRSKITKFQGQNWGQTYQTNVTSVPIQQTESYVLPTSPVSPNVQPFQYQSNYVPQNLAQSGNAYSLNYQRVAQA